MLNKVVIMGRLTADPELRMTQSEKPVATFTLAVERDFKGPNGTREADFINCVAWNNTAEFINKYFKKGNMAVVSGRLQTRKWEAPDGRKGIATEIVAENVYFGESKKTTQEAPAEQQQYEPIEVVDDDELPF
jgi:single-strand DNA-binding protein